MSELVLDHVTLHLSGRGAAGARRRLAARRAGRVRRRRRAARGRASRRCCAPPPGSCRTSTAASSRAGCVAGGLDSREHGPAELSAVAGSLFQDPETQVVMGTVRAELAFPLENRGWSAAAVARGVEEAALALGVAGLLDRSTHELSGGELQRVALGAALAGRPRLLLLDEPTSQLDPVAGDELLGVLRRVNEEWGTAVLLAEHRLERCLAAADRVIALEDGAVDDRRRPARLPRAGTARAADAGRPPVRGRRPDAAAGGGEGRAGRAARPRPERAPTPGAAPDPGARSARGSAAAPRLRVRARASSGVWLEIPRGPAILARRRPRHRARRARRADGAQRRRQVDAAAARRRACASRPAAGSRAAAAWRCCCRTPATTSSPSAWGTSCRPTRWPRPGWARSPTATRATSPAASASGSRSRSCCRASRPRSSASTSRPAAWTAGTRTSSPRTCASSPSAAARCSSPPTTPSSPPQWAERTVLLGDGAPVADAPTSEVLGGGWYFATQTARILGGGALLPEEGAALLPHRLLGAAAGRRSRHELARRLARRARPRARRGLRLVRAHAPHGARARARGDARRARRARAGSRSRRCPTSSRRPTSCCSPATRSAGAPGFAVGAVAALASNVFFGQGPWTPWQMCAWGGVGVGGALLARVAGRELGRASLAVACAVAGAAYGVVMNLHLWVTYSGDHSLAKLGAYFATSLPFDLAHVVGNVVFCLLFGPALVRALTRFRAALRGHLAPRARARRLRARRGRAARRRGAAAGRGGDAARAGSRARRTRDGGFGGDRGQRSTGIYTSWAGARPRRGGAQPARRRGAAAATSIAYVRAHPPARRADIGDTTRTILLLRAAGLPPRDRRPRPRQGAARQAPAERLVRQPRQHDRVRDLRAARRGPLAQRPRRPRPPRAGSRARRTTTAASTSPARAPPRGSTTPAPRSRRSSPPAAAARRPSAAPRASSSGARTPTAASRCSPAGRRTRSRRRGRSRGSSPPGATPTASAATARARRSPTCARSSPRAARSATRAPARRRRCG